MSTDIKVPSATRTVPLVADMRQTYEGHGLLNNEKFYATPGDAADLVALRFASRVAETPTTGNARKVPDAAPKTGDAGVPEITNESPKTTTRDMDSEDDKDTPKGRDRQAKYPHRAMNAKK